MSGTGTESVEHERDTARILLTDREGRLLMFLTAHDDVVPLPTRWLTPGGGIEAGEDAPTAALRELQEETGLAAESAGLPLTEIRFRRPRLDGAADVGLATYFRVECDRFTPSSDGWTDGERRDISEHRWWSPAELVATADAVEESDRIAVRDLLT